MTERDKQVFAAGGLPPAPVRQAAGAASHASSLCDIHAKYADVVKSAEVLSFFGMLPSGMFDLPAGASPAAAIAAE